MGETRNKNMKVTLLRCMVAAALLLSGVFALLHFGVVSGGGFGSQKVHLLDEALSEFAVAEAHGRQTMEDPATSAQLSRQATLDACAVRLRDLEDTQGRAQYEPGKECY